MYKDSEKEIFIKSFEWKVIWGINEDELRGHREYTSSGNQKIIYH